MDSFFQRLTCGSHLKGLNLVDASVLKNTDTKQQWSARLQYEVEGKRLIQIREDEFRDKRLIVDSMLLGFYGLHEKWGARELSVVDISWRESSLFYNDNHLQGAGTGYKLSLALEKNGILYCVLSLLQKGGVVEIKRFASRKGFTVAGGFSRLLAAASERFSAECLESWCDLRYANGVSYEKAGFIKVKETLGWSWTDFTQVYHRLKCRANMDSRGLSEKEHAAELKWVKIYDAGQRLYRRAL